VKAAVLEHYIDGLFTPSSETFLKRNPTTGAVNTICYEAEPAQVDAAVSAARAAYLSGWANASAGHRSFALHRIANVMQARRESLAHAVVADTGCSFEQALGVDVSRGINHFRFYADLATTTSDEAYTTITQDGEGAQNSVHRKPLGVVALFTPATLPLMWLTAKLAPALACGNTTVIKASEHAPACATELAHVVHESGLPKGIVNLLHGFGAGATGTSLAQHPGLDVLSLVGRKRTQRDILRARGPGTSRFLAEVGGKNAAIVFADADFGKALASLFKAVFFNSGQSCFSVEQIFVHRSLYDRFVLTLRAATVRLQIAPLISSGHRDAVVNFVRIAQEEGARVMCGGGIPQFRDERDNGSYFQPTILTGLPDASACHIAPFDDDDEVLNRVNAYSLVSCSFWSNSLRRVHKIAPQVRAGTVWVNTWFLRDLRAPFAAGAGNTLLRDGGRWSMENFSALTNVCIKY
jgi:aminomuconate-semialdehyde/2-hydroxymuconate-6-semialdehyde dehydrogenase